MYFFTYGAKQQTSWVAKKTFGNSKETQYLTGKSRALPRNEPFPCSVLLPGVPPLILANSQIWKIVAGIISTVLFLLGLLSSEVAISLPLFAFCYELSKSDDSWRVCIRYLLPSWVIALVYVMTYSALGFGARNSSVYLDPFTYPGDYAALFFPKLLAVLGSI